VIGFSFHPALVTRSVSLSGKRGYYTLTKLLSSFFSNFFKKKFFPLNSINYFRFFGPQSAPSPTNFPPFQKNS
jgi:hypothetical protein